MRESTESVKLNTYQRVLRTQTYPVHLNERANSFEFYLANMELTSEKYTVAAVFLFLSKIGFTLYSVMEARHKVSARTFGTHHLVEVSEIVEHLNSGMPTGKGHMIWRHHSVERGESLTHDIRKLRAIGVGGNINVFLHERVSVWEGDTGPRRSHHSDMRKTKR